MRTRRYGGKQCPDGHDLDLWWMKQAQEHRAELRHRARTALDAYVTYLRGERKEQDLPLTTIVHLMRAQEAARGARVRAKRLTEAWMAKCRAKWEADVTATAEVLSQMGRPLRQAASSFGDMSNLLRVMGFAPPQELAFRARARSSFALVPGGSLEAVREVLRARNLELRTVVESGVGGIALLTVSPAVPGPELSDAEVEAAIASVQEALDAQMPPQVGRMLVSLEGDAPAMQELIDAHLRKLALPYAIRSGPNGQEIRTLSESPPCPKRASDPGIIGKHIDAFIVDDVEPELQGMVIGLDSKEVARRINAGDPAMGTFKGVRARAVDSRTVRLEQLSPPQPIVASAQPIPERPDLPPGPKVFMEMPHSNELVRAMQDAITEDVDTEIAVLQDMPAPAPGMVRTVSLSDYLEKFPGASEELLGIVAGHFSSAYSSPDSRLLAIDCREDGTPATTFAVREPRL